MHNINLAKLIVFPVILVGLFSGNSAGLALAQDAEQLSFPYEQCFTVTAYYSPLPDQSRYATGNYQSEIRLEGRGTDGAGGRQVFPGMFAAPPEIPFGTKILFPDIEIAGFGLIGGVGAVYDRGGAIKTRSGECASSLDLWLGFGEHALNMTQTFGVRRITATVYGIDDALETNFKIPDFDLGTIPELRNKIINFEPDNFKQSLGLGDSGDEVKKLQEHLKQLGYYEQEINGVYDEATVEAVFQFQTEFDVLTNRNTVGAGYFGISTRTAMDRAIELFLKQESEMFQLNLGKGAVGPQVEKLQKALTDLGYLPENVLLSGMFDTNTVGAVLRFQLDHKVILNSTATGAGYFGPKTRATLNRILTAGQLKETENSSVDNSQPDSAAEIEEKPAQENQPVNSDLISKFSDLAEPTDITAASLALGDYGQDVENLQAELARLGYFKHPITGYFGNVTAHALFKLQQSWGIVKDKQDPAAGVYGGETLVKFNSIKENRLNTKVLIASKRLGEETLLAQNSPVETEKTNPATNQADNQTGQAEEGSLTADISPFERELNPGDSGEDVLLLQKLLKSLGFFKGTFVTDYFGENTENAVLTFQIERGIISSRDDLGAGRVGPTTLQELRESIDA